MHVDSPRNASSSNNSHNAKVHVSYVVTEENVCIKYST